MVTNESGYGFILDYYKVIILKQHGLSQGS